MRRRVAGDRRTDSLRSDGGAKMGPNNIDVCDDGVQALEYLRNNKHPDVVMSDIQMPNMNGYELIKAIRADDNLKHLNVLALTATATVEEHMKTEQAGFDGFFTKPIERTKVVDYFSTFNDNKER